MKNLQLLVGVIFWGFCAQLSGEPVKVIFGFSDAKQIPFAFQNNSGLVQDVTTELNSLQSKYHFILKFYPAERLRIELENGNIDIALFHNREWGWNLDLVSPVSPLLADSERYVTMNKSKRTQSVFDSVGVLPTLGVLGFSYGFTGFSLDQKLVFEKYKLTLVRNEITIIEMLEANRGEIGVVTSGMLRSGSKSSNLNGTIGCSYQKRTTHNMNANVLCALMAQFLPKN